MSVKIDRETDLQQDLIDECIKLKGFGFKLQDKYLKGKPDLFLKLPSGIMIFAEVKIIRHARYTLSPSFDKLQLDYMQQLHDNDIPVFGLMFAINPEKYVDFKIATYTELNRLYEKFGNIRYHITSFERCRTFEQIIQTIEDCFAVSKAQRTTIQVKITDKFYTG